MPSLVRTDIISAILFRRFVSLDHLPISPYLAGSISDPTVGGWRFPAITARKAENGARRMSRHRMSGWRSCNPRNEADPAAADTAAR